MEFGPKNQNPIFLEVTKTENQQKNQKPETRNQRKQKPKRPIKAIPKKPKTNLLDILFLLERGKGREGKVNYGGSGTGGGIGFSDSHSYDLLGRS